MYFTHLVLPEDLATFDSNRLSAYQRYVFVVVLSEDDFTLALQRFGPSLAASDACCFLLDHASAKALPDDGGMGSLFRMAKSEAPASDHSFVCSIRKEDLIGATEPRGNWIELFLGLEPTPEGRERKLRAAIHQSLVDQPGVVATYGPLAAKAIALFSKVLLRGHG